MTEIELEDVKRVFDIYAGKILSYKEYMAELELEKQNIEATFLIKNMRLFSENSDFINSISKLLPFE